MSQGNGQRKRWAGNETVVLVYFLLPLSCGKCSAFPAFRPGSRGGTHVRPWKPSSACLFQVRNSQQWGCWILLNKCPSARNYTSRIWFFLVIINVTLGSQLKGKKKTPALISSLECHSRGLTAGGFPLEFRIWRWPVAWRKQSFSWLCTDSVEAYVSIETL